MLEWFKEDCNERMNEKREYPEYTEESDNSSSVESFEEEYSDWQGSKGNIEKRKKYNQKISYACMIVSIALEGILYYIYWGWELSEKMLIYLYTGAVMLGVLFLANGFWILYNKMFHGQSLIWDKIFDLRDKEREKEERPYQSTIISEKVQEQAKQAYGNTIFIPWIENCENKLYGTGKGNKNHIDLNRLPLTVGKLAGSVDMVIDDQSISRRHAKFIRDGNKIYMTDLNSTNGTFKNGLRLLPNTSEVLEPGDEIRLGKLKFIYR